MSPHRLTSPKVALLATLGLLLVFAAAAAPPQQPRQLGHSVHGTVVNARNQPLSGAIVYCKNVHTLEILTVIADSQGNYVFHQLTPGVSYQLWAVWQQHKSAVRTDSEYETTPDLRLDLKVPVA